MSYIHHVANLEPSSGLVGRAEDIRSLLAAVSQSRLVTLIGPGGVGKTRLATELAVELETEFDRVIAFDLTTAVESALEALADLGPALTAGTSLVVIDNCEHVVDAVAGLVGDLMDQHKLMTVITTSRRPLHVAGERLYPVRPLATPFERAGLADLLASESVALFNQRCLERDPGFLLTDRNVEVIADICRLSDGLPIVIELAAGLTGSRTLEDIGAAMAQSTSGDLDSRRRDVHPHQRSIAQSIDWSLRLLEDQELVLLQCAASFRGSFTADALAQIHAAVGGSNTAALTDRLIEHSVMAFAATTGRYAMLDLVSRSVRSMTNPDVASALDAARHGWVVTRSEAIAERSAQADPDGTFPDFRYELPDLVAVSDVVAQNGLADDWLALVGPIAEWWVHQGGPVDIDRWRSCIEHQTKPNAAAVVLAGGLAFHFGHRGDHQESLHYAEVAAAFADQIGRAELAIPSLVAAANAHIAMGDMGAAVAASARAQESLLDPPNTFMQCIVLMCRASVESGKAQRSALYEQVVVRAGSTHPAMALVAQQHLARLVLEAGRLDVAASMAEAGVATAAELGFLEAVGTAHNTAGAIEFAQGNLTQATQSYLNAFAIGQQIGHIGVIADSLAGLAVVTHDRGDPEHAQTLAAQAQVLVPQIELPATLHIAQAADNGYDALAIRDIIATIATSAEAGTDQPDGIKLTSREQSVLLLLRGDLTQREIADELYVSPSTVRTHVKALYRKLGVHNRTSCVHFATVQGLLPAP